MRGFVGLLRNASIRKMCSAPLATVSFARTAGFLDSVTHAHGYYTLSISEDGQDWLDEYETSGFWARRRMIREVRRAV